MQLLKNKSYFITGTGTGVGKTIVTCALSSQLLSKGKSVIALKPIISGWDDAEDSDTAEILKSLNQLLTRENIDKISPWRFKEPLSPDIAARKEGKEISFSEITKFCKQSMEGYDYTLIEGVGGVMVPINDEKIILDLIKELDIPAIVVAGSYLGSISHTLTAIYALENFGIKVHNIIINESSDSVGVDETIKTLRNFTEASILAIPRAEGAKEVWRKIEDLSNIMRKE